VIKNILLLFAIIQLHSRSTYLFYYMVDSSRQRMRDTATETTLSPKDATGGSEGIEYIEDNIQQKESRPAILESMESNGEDCLISRSAPEINGQNDICSTDTSQQQVYRGEGKAEAELCQAVASKDWAQVCKLAKQLLDLENSKQEPLNIGKEIFFNQLTVFQADPLVWMDNFGNLNPMQPLNFAWERDALKEALSVNSNIDLVFDICATDRLNAFLASSHSEILHLSCHGIQGGYLAMEDGAGGTHFVVGGHLEDFFIRKDKPSSSLLKVVLVSACYSRDIGESFLAAGIPHVICCKTSKDRVRDEAAIEFTIAFYRALANGRPLYEAFMHAKQQVKLSPKVLESHLEVDKFVILPEGDNEYHNVPVVTRTPSPTPVHDTIPSIEPICCLPQPPKALIGRQLEVYRVIKAIRQEADIVYLVGPEGLGKRAMASFVAHYVNERRKLMLLDEVLWWPPIDSMPTDPVDQAFNGLFELLSTAPDLLENASYQEFREQIELRLEKHRTFLIIDTRDMANTDISMLGIFLQDLLHRLKTRTKLLILCDKSASIELIKTRRSTREIELEPLTFESSAILFGKFCEYVCYQSEHADPIAHSVADFVNLIFRRDSYRNERRVTESMSKRSADLFAAIGEGYPAMIEKKTALLTPLEYQEIIKTAKKNDVILDFTTRHELQRAILRTNLEIHDAESQGQYQKAQEQFDFLQELERLKKTMPSKEKLKQQQKEQKRLHSSFVAENKTNKARAVRRNLSNIEYQLSLEESAGNLSDGASSITHSVQSSEDDTTAAAAVVSDKNVAEEQQQQQPFTKFAAAESRMVPKMKDMEGIITTSYVSDEIQPESSLVADFYVPNRHYDGDKSHPFQLQIHHGPVQSFSRPTASAVVVASNEACTGGVGVLRAITELGGSSLLDAVTALSTVEHSKYGPIRCIAGDATMVGPGSYGSLSCPYIIFAVAPWSETENEDYSLLFLTAAYRSALELAKEAKLEAIAFSLLGASCRGGVENWKKAVRIGWDSIARFHGYPELKEVHVYAFASREVNELMTVSQQYDFLEKKELEPKYNKDNWNSF